VNALNAKLRGWASYFCLGPVSNAYKAVDRYTVRRLRKWLCHKHRKRGTGRILYPDEYLYQRLGLVRLPLLTRNFPWAKA
jgi:RNA-directed DNA polymerase